MHLPSLNLPPFPTPSISRRDTSGRAALPIDQPEGRASEAWRASLPLPCVVPAALGERANSTPPRASKVRLLGGTAALCALVAALGCA